MRLIEFEDIYGGHIYVNPSKVIVVSATVRTDEDMAAIRLVSGEDVVVKGHADGVAAKLECG